MHLISTLKFYLVFMKYKKLLTILSILTGVFWLISGAGKIVDSAAFSVLITNYGFDQLSILAPLISASEIILGISMILMIFPVRTTAFVSILMLVVFTVIHLYGLFFHHIASCGCFGVITMLNTNPLVSFLRNLLLILISFFILVKSLPAIGVIVPVWKKLIVYVVSIISLITSGYTINVSLSPTMSFVNKNIKNTPLDKYCTVSPDSTYLIFVFNYNCTHCWDASENVKQYASSKVVDRVIGIAAGAYKQSYYDRFHPNFQIKDISIDSISDLTNRFPTAFYVKGDTIRYEMKESIHSPYTLQLILKNK